MALFDPNARNRSETHRRLYALYEIWYTTIDFGAALCFVIGSVLFFSASTQTAATWFFLVGSLLFAAKPTLRLVRELHYLKLGDIETLARRQDPL
ncbi:YrhK family protein [Pelagibacterium flavum]|uniref:YrhK family protein n=1 Tax=Pelagibacterium flavum TaxID=2984530 RepID=A0ABY6IPS6_9HYPH|nr:YrhK family protein [Pelagibacterium sp. YIM 151497]UYQ72404.1 YrhK family protein [Pelagibacterium sp. YIM 151497]|tara:strand:+ start:1641 stop:1925 length:285 start_codon:yes stop_codon:yes gene_type:complete|eukprot:jgi/Tetstr1/452094/TSEL_039130.t1